MTTFTPPERPATGPAPHHEFPHGGPGRAPDSPDIRPKDTLVDDAVSLMDSVVEYMASIFRLERYRFEVRTRRFVQKAVVVVSGIAVLLTGAVFVSVGLSKLISDWLQTPYAGPLIIGGIYVVIGLIVLMIVARKGED